MKHPVSTPLVINLPAYPAQDIADVDSYLPSFLHQYPTATIHYRWSSGRDEVRSSDDAVDPHPEAHGIQPIPTPLRWPTPISDTLAAYDFLRKTFSPSARSGGSSLKRRDIYVHGSYLGASLGASLALTETYVHEPVAIRGLSAYNGLYNWTTFLPDHPINRISHDDKVSGALVKTYNRANEDVAQLRDLMPALFGSPENLFDPFASSVLFFHTAGMMVPPSFTERYSPQRMLKRILGKSSQKVQIDDDDWSNYVYSDPEDLPPPVPYPEAEVELEEGIECEQKDDHNASDASSTANDVVSLANGPSPPSAAATITSDLEPTTWRKGHYRYPPRQSVLSIPQTLLLHSTAPPLPEISSLVAHAQRSVVFKKLRNAENSFGAQALALGSLMRRSVNKYEVQPRMKWDDESANLVGEAARRVRIEEAGKKSAEAEEIAAQWFEERMS